MCFTVFTDPLIQDVTDHKIPETGQNRSFDTISANQN